MKTSFSSAGNSTRNSQSPFKLMAILWIFFGIILLLLTHIISLHDISWAPVRVLISLIESIGIALMIAGLFDVFSHATMFKNHLSACMKELVFDKEYFINNCSHDERRELLRTLLVSEKPATSMHQDIDGYINAHLSESLDFLDENCRGATSIETIFEYNDRTREITRISTFSYNIYKTDKKFKPIKTGVEINKGTELIEISLTDDNGKHEKLDISKPTETFMIDKTGNEWDRCAYEIPPEMQNSSYITVRRAIKNTGIRDWSVASFSFSAPTNGFDIKISYPDDFEIQSQDFFLKNKEVIDHEIHNKSIKKHLSCSHWLAPGLGYSILVAKKSSNI